MDMELGDDEELDPTDAELEAEAEAEPGMMVAGCWLLGRLPELGGYHAGAMGSA